MRRRLVALHFFSVWAVEVADQLTSIFKKPPKKPPLGLQRSSGFWVKKPTLQYHRPSWSFFLHEISVIPAGLTVSKCLPWRGITRHLELHSIWNDATNLKCIDSWFMMHAFLLNTISLSLPNRFEMNSSSAAYGGFFSDCQVVMVGLHQAAPTCYADRKPLAKPRTEKNLRKAPRVTSSKWCWDKNGGRELSWISILDWDSLIVKILYHISKDCSIEMIAPQLEFVRDNYLAAWDFVNFVALSSSNSFMLWLEKYALPRRGPTFFQPRFLNKSI